MRAFKVIKDPEAFQLLADETRRRMIYLLRAKELTVSQIAAELDRTPQAIYHHIRKLKEAGMVEVAREERVDHFIETYYQATAEVFHLAYGEGAPTGYAESQTAEALKSLRKLGIHIEPSPEVVTRLVELEGRIDRIGERGEWTDRIAELEDVDFMTKQTLMYCAKLLSMSDDEFAEYLRLQREARKLLRSTLKKPAKG